MDLCVILIYYFFITIFFMCIDFLMVFLDIEMEFWNFYFVFGNRVIVFERFLGSFYCMIVRSCKVRLVLGF